MEHPLLSACKSRDLALVICADKPACAISLAGKPLIYSWHRTDFELFLASLSVYWECKDPWTAGEQRRYPDGSTAKSHRDILSYIIGSTPANLDRARSARTPSEHGVAYGYPQDAIDAFITDKKRRGDLVLSECHGELGDAAPSWLAYLDHLPARSNLIKGDFSESSRQLCIRYQTAIRVNYPSLATTLEAEFFEKCRKEARDSLSLLDRLSRDWWVPAKGIVEDFYNQLLKRSSP